MKKGFSPIEFLKPDKLEKIVEKIQLKQRNQGGL
ncbi:DUF3898 domain-containing protein [Bacillus albus]